MSLYESWIQLWPPQSSEVPHPAAQGSTAVERSRHILYNPETDAVWINGGDVIRGGLEKFLREGDAWTAV